MPIIQAFYFIIVTFALITLSIVTFVSTKREATNTA